MIVGDGPAHRGSLRSPARRENLVEFEVAGDLAAALGSARATACGPRAPARGVGDRSVVTTCSSSPRTTGRLVATDWTRQRSADVSRTVIFDRRSGRVHLVDQKSPSSSWRVAKLRHRPAGWRLRASLPNGQPARPRRTGTGGRRVGSVIGITIAVRPVLGGPLVIGIGRRLVRRVNIPIEIAAFLPAQRFVPESRAARARASRPAGSGADHLPVCVDHRRGDRRPRRGWAGLAIIGLFPVRVLVLIGLLVVGARRSEPLVDLRFFRSPPFSGANTISLVRVAGLVGFLFLYPEDHRHFSPLPVGLEIIPPLLGQAVVANRPVAVSGVPLDQVGVAGALTASAPVRHLIGIAVAGTIVAGPALASSTPVAPTKSSSEGADFVRGWRMQQVRTRGARRGLRRPPGRHR